MNSLLIAGTKICQIVAAIVLLLVMANGPFAPEVKLTGDSIRYDYSEHRDAG